MKPAGLGRALTALGPYLEDIVICGAWAWYLYRRCLAPGRDLPTEFTRDLDCVGPERLPVREAPILDRLEQLRLRVDTEGRRASTSSAFRVAGCQTA